MGCERFDSVREILFEIFSGEIGRKALVVIGGRSAIAFGSSHICILKRHDDGFGENYKIIKTPYNFAAQFGQSP